MYDDSSNHIINCKHFFHDNYSMYDYLIQQKKQKRWDLCMPAQWTGDVIGKMHVHSITSKQLAEHLGYNPKYVSAVLNGKRSPKKSEQLFENALNTLIEQKEVFM